jgi:Legionella pneumophila major outer membrane protein precursor
VNLQRLLFPLFLFSCFVCFAAEEKVEAMPKKTVAKPDSKDDSKKPKNKAHFIGVRRPTEKTEEKKRPNSAAKNPWVKSKTYPKDKKDKQAKEKKDPVKDQTSSSEVPHFTSSRARSRLPLASISTSSLLFPESNDTYLEPETISYETFSDDDSSYPHLGKDAPSGHVYFTADWLFWRTRESGLEFAVHGASSSATTPYPHSAPSKCNFDLTSGFRTGFGVHLPDDGWDIFVNYTDFRPKASKSVDGALFPLLLYTPPSLAASAHAEWKITFQTLDIEIGRAYYIGRTLSFRPFLGMTGAWIGQKADIDYKGNSIPSGAVDNLSARNDFKGAGPRVGAGSNWHFGEGLSLFGNGALVLAVGHFDLKNHQSQADVETIHLASDLNLISPTLSLIAGLAWDRNFLRDTRHVGLSAGFETQYWWRQNQLERFTDSSTPLFVRTDGDLAFYGLTVRGRFDF